MPKDSKQSYNNDMTDQELITLASKIDNFLLEQMEENNETPLTVSAVMLSRLQHFNHTFGTDRDYYDLLDQASMPIEFEIHTLH